MATGKKIPMEIIIINGQIRNTNCRMHDDRLLKWQQYSKAHRYHNWLPFQTEYISNKWRHFVKVVRNQWVYTRSVYQKRSILIQTSKIRSGLCSNFNHNSIKSYHIDCLQFTLFPFSEKKTSSHNNHRLISWLIKLSKSISNWLQVIACRLSRISNSVLVCFAYSYRKVAQNELITKNKESLGKK